MIVKKNLDIKLKYNLISKLQAPGFPYYACTRSYFRKIEITPVPREITPPPLLRYVPKFFFDIASLLMPAPFIFYIQIKIVLSHITFRRSPSN